MRTQLLRSVCSLNSSRLKRSSHCYKVNNSYKWLCSRSFSSLTSSSRFSSSTIPRFSFFFHSRYFSSSTSTKNNLLGITADDVIAAYERIRPVVSKSPLDYSPKLSTLTGNKIYLKKEHISITGSYKERGALNKILQLTPEERAKGVVCSSAGNHAQAVSYHSTRLGIDGVIVMPITTPFVKVNATRSFGAKVVLSGTSFGGAYEKALEIAKTEGRTFIHAFNDPKIVAGQGTCGIELLEQNPFLDAIVVPIGGGGLIAGISLIVKSINPRIKIYGVEAEAMPGMLKSVQAGKVVSVPKAPTMADGIAIENVGQVPFDVIKNHVDDIVTVTEAEIAGGVLKLLEVEKTVLEGSGAAGLAAVMADKLPLKDKTVAVVLTGGNIDMSVLGKIIEKGLVKDGRMARIRVTVDDTPGELSKISQVLTKMRANIRDIEHERAFLLDNVGTTQPVLTIETRGFDHVHSIVEELKRSGFRRVALETPHS